MCINRKIQPRHSKNITHRTLCLINIPDHPTIIIGMKEREDGKYRLSQSEHQNNRKALLPTKNLQVKAF